MTLSEADYIVVRRGLVRYALALRLCDRDATFKVLIIEAGPDPTGNPPVTDFGGTLASDEWDMNWEYKTAPQKHTEDREHDESAGKAVRGGRIINYGGWFRGDASDYN